MWQRFTERARNAILYAQEEAQKAGEGYVSTEHILLGVCRDNNCTAAIVLSRLGISTVRVQSEIARMLPRGDTRPNRDMTLTPRGKRVIDLAYEEARELGNNFIDTEHLLLGVVREADGLAGRVLAKLGVELQAARIAAISVQNQDATIEPPKTSAPTTKAGRAEALEISQQLIAFLGGHCLPHHLMLSLIADSESLTARVVAAQCENLSRLQWELWLAIVGWSKNPLVAPEPEALTLILQIAGQEADPNRIRPKHILLALLQADGSKFSEIMARHGITQDRTRELIGEMENTVN
jgi:ATP-dependent Clp protease ATP-binding subunit ClpA